MVKVLAISNLYPNPVRPRHGIFTEHRLQWLSRSPSVEEVRVISPIPAFPLPSLSIWPYAHLSSIPKRDNRNGIEVHYPRYLNIPKIGMSLQPNLMAKTLISAMKQIQRDGFDFDVIDAFYLYPDAVAAAIAAEYFGKPLVATAFGNDLSLIASNSPRAARRILWAVDRAESCTTVCRALEDILIDMGASPNKVQVILHGVDAELFKPVQNRDALRSTLGISGPTLLTAGHLIERKGIHIAVEALKYLPTFSLLVAGDGPEESSLKTLALKYGVSDRITFLGHVDQAALAEYYAASDAFILMSSREGIANVMMESMSCGTPVVATNVYGAPEIITCPEAGILVPSRTVSALVTGIEALFSNMPTRDATRNHASQFNWSETTRNHVEIYKTFNLKY